MGTTSAVQKRLAEGLVIPACPLALTAGRALDERHQRALFRYYLASGAGGLAVAVHTTQFGIRDPRKGLHQPVLELAAEVLDEARSLRGAPRALAIAGICGRTPQACAEASLSRELGFDAGLLSLGAMKEAAEHELISHCRTVSEVIPLFGFYLQPAVGGRLLSYGFWRRFAEIENVVAVKIAPFNRYQTLDVVRAFADSGRDEVALYTGNDDSILMDLLTPFQFAGAARRIVGGLLGHWAVWTHRAVEQHRRCRALALSGSDIPAEMLRLNVEVTDANSALFDAANGFAGCIPGIHEVLRRQGLLQGTWCLDENEKLSPGQMEEIDRVCGAYPHLSDDAFVAEHLDQWLS